MIIKSIICTYICIYFTSEMVGDCLEFLLCAMLVELEKLIDQTFSNMKETYHFQKIKMTEKEASNSA